MRNTISLFSSLSPLPPPFFGTVFSSPPFSSSIISPFLLHILIFHVRFLHFFHFLMSLSSSFYLSPPPARHLFILFLFLPSFLFLFHLSSHSLSFFSHFLPSPSPFPSSPSHPFPLTLSLIFQLPSPLPSLIAFPLPSPYTIHRSVPKPKKHTGTGNILSR